MNSSIPSTRNPLQPSVRRIYRWATIGALTVLGAAALWPTASVEAEGVSATVCVPGPDNFCPATPTVQPLLLKLYLAEVQRDDGVQP